MKLVLTNLGKMKIPSSSLTQPFFHENNFNFIPLNWKTFTTHFNGDVTQKSCVLKMADGRAYLTLFHRQKDIK